MDFRKIFDLAVTNDASDIHIQALLPPMVRIAGRMRLVESASLSNDQIIDCHKCRDSGLQIKMTVRSRYFVIFFDFFRINLLSCLYRPHKWPTYPYYQTSLSIFEILIMRKKNIRLDSLLEWAKNTYGSEVSQLIARQSPREDADFWIALNKARATHNQKYQGTRSVGKSALSHWCIEQKA